MTMGVHSLAASAACSGRILRMIETIANDPLRWSSLRTVAIPVLRSFLVRNDPSGTVLVVITESMDGRSRLEATFLGVIDLRVSWPEYPDPVQLDVIDI